MKAALLLAFLATSCASTPKYRVTGEPVDAAAKVAPGSLPVQVGSLNLNGMEILGKVWNYKYASTSFSTVDEQELFAALSIPAAALGASEIRGAHSSELATLSGTHIEANYHRWASGIATRKSPQGGNPGPADFIVSIPPVRFDPLLEVKPERQQELDEWVRSGAVSALEELGYYARLSNSLPPNAPLPAKGESPSTTLLGAFGPYDGRMLILSVDGASSGNIAVASASKISLSCVLISRENGAEWGGSGKESKFSFGLGDVLVSAVNNSAANTCHQAVYEALDGLESIDAKFKP